MEEEVNSLTKRDTFEQQFVEAGEDVSAGDKENGEEYKKEINDITNVQSAQNLKPKSKPDNDMFSYIDEKKVSHSPMITSNPLQIVAVEAAAPAP